MRLVLLFCAVIIFCCTINAQVKYPKRELRGAWIATVANIDYPADRSSSCSAKVAELRMIFERLKSAGINTVFFQVRTECDALYKSEIEPWSYWLTGKQGHAPDTLFDPLSIAIEEAHKYGMEIHAWLNPFRSVKTVDEYEVSDKHISKTHPEWILRFKDLKMLNPGIPEVREYILSVIDDIISRYDVDGIHFDDYFYPYGPRITNEDTAAFKANPRGFANVEYWRRDNVNSLIASVGKLIKSKNPAIKFGIAPFGIVKNSYAGTSAFESYYNIYCDPVAWINSKSVDYVLPQIYWEIGHKKADFKKIITWWSSIKTDRHIYAGHFASSYLNPKYSLSENELENQIDLVRSKRGIKGSVFFSAKTIIYNWKHFADTLMYTKYMYPALVPVMNWKGLNYPAAPKEGRYQYDSTSIKLSWECPTAKSNADSVYQFVVYKFNPTEQINLDNAVYIKAILPSSQNTFTDEGGYGDYKYIITSLNRAKVESKEYLKINVVK